MLEFCRWNSTSSDFLWFSEPFLLSLWTVDDETTKFLIFLPHRNPSTYLSRYLAIYLQHSEQTRILYVKMIFAIMLLGQSYFNIHTTNYGIMHVYEVITCFIFISTMDRNNSHFMSCDCKTVIVIIWTL